MGLHGFPLSNWALPGLCCHWKRGIVYLDRIRFSLGCDSRQVGRHSLASFLSDGTPGEENLRSDFLAPWWASSMEMMRFVSPPSTGTRSLEVEWRLDFRNFFLASRPSRQE